MSVTCLIVEDHHQLRLLLCSWLESLFPGVLFVGLESGEAAVEFARAYAPALILMDIHLPGMNGIEATRRIKARRPQVFSIIHTLDDDPAYRQDAHRAGADAFVSKNHTADLVPLLTKYFDTLASGDDLRL